MERRSSIGPAGERLHAGNRFAPVLVFDALQFYQTRPLRDVSLMLTVRLRKNRQL